MFILTYRTEHRSPHDLTHSGYSAMRPSNFGSDQTSSDKSESPKIQHRLPCRKSAQDSKQENRADKGNSRRQYRVVPNENAATPLIVQAALLPLEISKPSTPATHLQNPHPRPQESPWRFSQPPHQTLEPNFPITPQIPQTRQSPQPPPQPPSLSPPLHPASQTTVENTVATIPPPGTAQNPYGTGQPPGRPPSQPTHPQQQTFPQSYFSTTQPYSSPEQPTQVQAFPQAQPQSQTQYPVQIYPQPQNQTYSQPQNEAYSGPTSQPQNQSYSQPSIPPYTQPQNQPFTQPQNQAYTQSPTQSPNHIYPRPPTQPQNQSYSQPSTESQNQPFSQPLAQPCSQSYQQPSNPQHPQPTQLENVPYLQPSNSPCPQPSTQSQNTQPPTQPQIPAQPSTQPANESLPQSSNQPDNPSYSPQPQPQNAPYSQPHTISTTPPLTIPQSLTPTQAASQPEPLSQPTTHPPTTRPPSRIQPTFPTLTTSPRPTSNFLNNRFSDTGNRNSSTAYPPNATRTYPPAKPVLPMPKPPLHIQQILLQQEELVRHQQQLYLQHQLQALQNLQQTVAPQLAKMDLPHFSLSYGMSERESSREESEDTESVLSSDGPSLKQRCRPCKRGANNARSPLRGNTQSIAGNSQPFPNQQRPASSSGAPPTPPPTASQRMFTIPPHPYGTIIPRFSAQGKNIAGTGATQPNHMSQTSRMPVNQPNFLQNPPTTNVFCMNAQQTTVPTLASPFCQTKPTNTTSSGVTPMPQSTYKPDTIKEYPEQMSHQNPIKTEDNENRIQVSDELLKATSENSEQQNLKSEDPPTQHTQGVQARLSHVQPLHSPALQTTHVIGSIQMLHTNDCIQGKQEDGVMQVHTTNSPFLVQSAPVYQTAQNPFNPRNSYSHGQQQAFQLQQQWQQTPRHVPSPQTYVQLGTFPPNMATFSRPTTATFVQNIQERPLKPSLTPGQMQPSQLCTQNTSNAEISIHQANSCPGALRINQPHAGLIYCHRSAHPSRTLSGSRRISTDSLNNVWECSSNPHYLP